MIEILDEGSERSLVRLRVSPVIWALGCKSLLVAVGLQLNLIFDNFLD